MNAPLPSSPGAMGAQRSLHKFQPARFAAFARHRARQARDTALGQASGALESTAAGGPNTEARFRRPSGRPGRIQPVDPSRRGPDSWPGLEPGLEPLGDDWQSNGGLIFGGGSATRSVGLGYHADLPDVRDHDRTRFVGFLEATRQRSRARFARRRALGSGESDPDAPEPFLHLSQFGELPVVEDQGELGSCTAHAVIGMAELLLLRYGALSLDLSRLFLYKCTRRLLGWTGDTGAFIRTTIKALRLFGSLPEEQWPYRADLLDAEPDAFTYAYARSFRALEYARLDGYGATGAETLAAIKQALLHGHPVAFGFPVFESIAALGPDYVIPVPSKQERRLGGHAVMVAGYNDLVQVPPVDGATPGPGALIIRNSWGPDWGDAGYAYLPYWYVLNQYAVDFWTLYGIDWLEESAFDHDAHTHSARVR